MSYHNTLVILFLLFSFCIPVSASDSQASANDPPTIIQDFFKAINVVNKEYLNHPSTKNLFEEALKEIRRECTHLRLSEDGLCVASTLTDNNMGHKSMSDLYHSIEIKYPNQAKETILNLISRVLFSLDEYNDIISVQDLKLMAQENRQTTVGIRVKIIDRLPEVSYVKSDSMAARVGMKAGDKITNIDGFLTDGVRLSHIQTLLGGKAGSTVALQVYSNKQKLIQTFTLTRKMKPTPALLAKKIDSIQYVKLSSLYDKSAQDFENILKNKDAYEGLIVDMRNNLGGLLRDANQIANALGKGHVYNVPTIIITNGQTANGSEVIADAVRHNKTGLLIGSKTYGGGSIHRLIPLPSGNIVKLFVGPALGEDKRELPKGGVIPDIEFVDDQIPEKENLLRLATYLLVEARGLSGNEAREKMLNIAKTTDLNVGELIITTAKEVHN